MRKLVLALFLLLSGCATVTSDAKAVGTELKADAEACKSVAAEEVHDLFPLLADWGICRAFHAKDPDGGASACSAQEQSLISTGKDAAIKCGLAAIQKADQDALAHASNVDGGSGD